MSDTPIIGPVKAVNTTGYVIMAIVVMSLFGIVGVVLVQIMKPDSDNTTLITMIVGFIASMTTSLLALMKAQETHLSVNSRLDQFMSTAKAASHAEGILEGQGMQMVSRTQGPVEIPSKAGSPPNIGFKITSIYMKR